MSALPAVSAPQPSHRPADGPAGDGAADGGPAQCLCRGRGELAVRHGRALLGPSLWSRGEC